MALGEGSRKVGEPCWSHAQCSRHEKNSYCSHLVCVCDSEFHTHDGKCSRNYWEDLGLQNWQLLVISMVITLFFLAVFIGCLYYVFLRIVRKYRRTRPAGELAPTESFKVPGGDSKKNSLTGETAMAQEVKLAGMRQSMRRKSQSIERARLCAQLRRESIEKEKEEEEREQTAARMQTVMEVADDVVPTTSIRPSAKFILPLHYSHNQGEGEGRGKKRNLRRNSSFGSWSLSSWEVEPLEAGLDWWPRRQFRRPAINKGEAAKTMLPLLLHGSGSESDDSE